MTYQAVLFDLDGTLLDTLDDLAASVNRVLSHHGFPIHAREAFRWFIGDGSKMLMTRALPEDQRAPEQIETCLQEFLDDYRHNWDVETYIYDGIGQLLDTLVFKQVAMAVVTNKPHPFAVLTMDHYFSRVPFFKVLGQHDDIPKKPDPRQALAVASEMGITPSRCIFLGDSAVDMETAQRAGMTPIGAGWGFRPVQELEDAGAHIVISHPLELLDILDHE